MFRMIWRTIFFSFVIAVILTLGVLAGAWFGGNYTQDFQFDSVRGSEATGQAGLFCFSLALFLVGAFYWIKK